MAYRPGFSNGLEYPKINSPSLPDKSENIMETETTIKKLKRDRSTDNINDLNSYIDE